MKCVVVVVLCAALAASPWYTLGAEATFARRSGRPYDGGHYSEEHVDYGYQPVHHSTVPDKYYQNENGGYTNQEGSYHNRYVEQPNVINLNDNLHYPDALKYQQENTYEQGNAKYYHDFQKSSGVQYGAPPTYSTPAHYSAPPLSPYPPQYNQHQAHQGVTSVHYQIAPQPNYSGYSDLFDGPVVPTKPLTTVKTTVAPRPPPPSKHNNILSLLLSLSQSSSKISLLKTTSRPLASTTTSKAPSQPPPPAQVYTFLNVPPQYQSHHYP